VDAVGVAELLLLLLHATTRAATPMAMAKASARGLFIRGDYTSGRAPRSRAATT
jgi:hypothetical protein